MGRLLERLKRNDPTYALEPSDEGFLLIRRDGQKDTFDSLARELIDHAGEEFVVFPTTDGAQGYERVYVIPVR